MFSKTNATIGNSVASKEKRTSEYIKDDILDFFFLAKIRVDTTSLELAKGRMTNETKNEGMLVAVEKLSTTSTRGSAITAAIRVPRSNIKPALEACHLAFSILSTASSF
jgi:hypothetical protein